MPKAKKLPRTIAMPVRVAMLNQGDIFAIVKIDAQHLADEFGKYSDKEMKEIIQQEVENAVHEKLKLTLERGSLVKAVSEVRRRQTS